MPAHATAAYPEIKITNTEGKAQPSFLTVGDSYWWNIRNMNNSIFKEQRFWYYNTDAYPETKAPWAKVAVSTLNFDKVIDQTDVIILCYTESTVGGLGSGIIEKLNQRSGSRPEADPVEGKQQEIRQMADYIRSNNDWMKILQERSKKEQIPLDTLILWDATWQVNRKK
jgi:hypothetical protein